jgi:hypothetical protein
MQQRYGYPGSYIEPDGYIQMALSSFYDGAKQVNTKNNPYQGNSNINGPFQFSIFFAGSVTQ